ncbi:Ab1-108 protein [Platysternon megacephalum]|uniref:Ab1-108 protein n=1 Tax=Platysternon megacephalum TaxID=55544 RepID=A0A4D9E6C6_9SAUR|nr:Ab1-108 protein [Platysternon megacephalum]
MQQPSVPQSYTACRETHASRSSTVSAHSVEGRDYFSLTVTVLPYGCRHTRAKARVERKRRSRERKRPSKLSICPKFLGRLVLTEKQWRISVSPVPEMKRKLTQVWIDVRPDLVEKEKLFPSVQSEGISVTGEDFGVLCLEELG